MTNRCWCCSKYLHFSSKKPTNNNNNNWNNKKDTLKKLLKAYSTVFAKSGFVFPNRERANSKTSNAFDNVKFALKYELTSAHNLGTSN